MAPTLYMYAKRWTSNIIAKSIARSNVNSNGSENNNEKFHRRQEAELTKDTNNKTTSRGRNKITPTPIVSIPTITTSTFVTTTTDITDIPPPTDTGDTPLPTDTSLPTEPTDTSLPPTDTSPSDTVIPVDTIIPINTIPVDTIPVDTIPVDTIIPTDTIIPVDTGADTSIPPTDTSPLPTDSSSMQSPLDTTITTAPTSTTLTIPTAPTTPTISDTNGTNPWLFIAIASSLLILALLILSSLFIRRRRRRRNVNNNNNNNNLRNIGTGVNDEEKAVGNISMDKDKENHSKSNSLTSINSISSSFKKKKGKVVPGDVVSPPATSATLSSLPIVTDNNNEKEIRPKLERIPTSVSAFTEMVDLTEEENDNLRRSVNSGLYTVAARFSNISNSNSSGSAVTVQQERIDSMILSPSMIPEASTSASGSGNGHHNLRTISFTRPPSDTSSNDDNDN